MLILTYIFKLLDQTDSPSSCFMSECSLNESLQKWQLRYDSVAAGNHENVFIFIDRQGDPVWPSEEHST